MKTLILTNSFDSTTDLLIFHLGTENVFRFNFDQWDSYKFRYEESGFIISSEHHSITSSEIAKAYWRKPFIHKIASSEDSSLNNYLNDEVRSYFKEIYSWCIENKKAVLIDPFRFERFGKIAQARAASRYFKIPVYELIWNNSTLVLQENIVAKTLSSPILGKGFLYTTRLAGKQIDPAYPWYLQEEINADADVTVVYINGLCMSFKCIRDTFANVDWRTKIGMEEMVWEKFEITELDKSNIVSLMDGFGLKFGRLDFLINKDELIFLEVNPNGQWAWLDVDNKHGLLRKMCDILNPDTSIQAVVD